MSGGIVNACVSKGEQDCWSAIDLIEFLSFLLEFPAAGITSGLILAQNSVEMSNVLDEVWLTVS